MTQLHSANLDSALGALEQATVQVRRALASPRPDYLYVPSSDGQTAYLIQREWTCTCEGFKYRHTCRHLDEYVGVGRG